MKPKFLLTLLLLLAWLPACRGTIPETSAPVPPETPTPETMVQRSSSKISAASLNELVGYSDVIVVGKVVAAEGIVNTARNPEDPSQPDPRSYSLGQVYSLDAGTVLKGDLPGTLRIVQHQGRIPLIPGVTPSPVEIELEIEKNSGEIFLPLSIDTNYLFFLRVLDEGDYALEAYRSTELYTPAAEPWLFRLTSEGRVIVETTLPGQAASFPEKTLAEVEAIVSDPWLDNGLDCYNLNPSAPDY